MTDDGPDDQPGPSRQRDVYMQGLAGVTPDLPVSYEDLEAAALEALDDDAAGYVAGGVGGEETMDANREAFRRWRIVPRMLRDVAERDRSVELFGRELSAPVLLAPIGVLSIVHDGAERAVAEAAADLDVPMVLSTASSVTLETVAETLDDEGGRGWFQLYWSSDRAVTESLVTRAEAAGYEALVVTVDTPLLSWRERDVDDAYLPFLDGEGIANYRTDPAFLDRLDADPEENELAAVREFVDVFGDPSLTWDDLAWLTDLTDLPVVVKGVLHPDDAQAAVDHGADGVVVSNHGGRQVDRAIPALEVLPEVVDRVGDDGAVLFDSGIRRGADAVVALALGADAVLLGRPYVYGLALDGADGVRAVCENFLADFDLTLGLAGQRSVAELDRSALRRRDG
ncbi:alpha-hydroxy-acid oxidizing protein [Halosimplex salinum]|uniref:alpha-hydroxy-acid oxidizing protein n=1 Tax=Halosimplex salinum TaxID=1710538 RepID=UPI000F4A0A97|nr:alpha-hydroxy-acid oxidizing protein [Halosimplex salinum]